MAWNTDLAAAPHMDEIFIWRKSQPGFPMLGWHHTGSWYIYDVEDGEPGSISGAHEVFDVVAWMRIPKLTEED